MPVVLPHPFRLLRALALAAVGAMLGPIAGHAQMNAAPPGVQLGPSGNPAALASPGATLLSPGGFQPGPPQALRPPAAQQALGDLSASQVPLYTMARFGPNTPPIGSGLVWRVYADKPDATGAFRLLREDKNAMPTFSLPPGGYVIHVSFGLASASKAVQLRSDAVREAFDIPAGGLTIRGQVGDVRIPDSQMNFDLFKGSQFEPGDKRAIAENVMAGDVVLVPEGTYTIVSSYGDTNSVVRSDIRVQAGKLTDVAVTHRAAVITLKLVSASGGEAIANTGFSVLTPGGDVIKESIGAFPRMILAEGDYRVIARNEGRSYERDFKVVTGVDAEVEVIAR